MCALERGIALRTLVGQLNLENKKREFGQFDFHGNFLSWKSGPMMSYIQNALI